MTGKERDILVSFKEDLTEVKRDMKSLLEFMHTYTQRAKGCDEKFKAMEAAGNERAADIKALFAWRWKTTGAISLLTFLLGIAAKTLKVF